MNDIDSALNSALGQTRFGERPLSNREVMQRTAALCATSSPAPKCSGNVFVGMFFDGTGNNEGIDFTNVRDNPRQQKHSNVVRLYHAHPDQKVIGGNGYYRFYIPGLGTPFPEIGDTDESWSQALGSIGGLKGAARIAWGLTRIFNAVSRFVYNQLLIPDADAATIANGVSDRFLWNYPRNEGRLQTWLQELEARIANRKPAVNLITVNVFGFSRGAAEARAFVNWIYKLCEEKDGGWLFAGIPFRVQFMGLFDTVASVGLSGLLKYSEGHAGWASDNMQVHPAVERCVHMVAGHEVRACFPVDSVRVKGKYPPNVVEYVYPGSHSDVGGVTWRSV